MWGKETKKDRARARQSKQTRRQQVGALGEDLAERYLQGKGYRLLASNVKNRCGEIDRIMQHPQGWLCFIEVKTLSGTEEDLASNDSYSPIDHFTAHKMQALERTIYHYLQEHKQEDVRWQLDLVTVVLDQTEGKSWLTHHDHVSLE